MREARLRASLNAKHAFHDGPTQNTRCHNLTHTIFLRTSLTKSSSFMRPSEAAPGPSPKTTSIKTTAFPLSIASMTTGSGPVVVDIVVVAMMLWCIEEQNKEQRRHCGWRLCAWQQTRDTCLHCLLTLSKESVSVNDFFTR